MPASVCRGERGMENGERDMSAREMKPLPKFMNFT